MRNGATKLILILAAMALVYVVVSSILGFILRIVTIVLVAGVILFLLSLGSRSDDDA